MSGLNLIHFVESVGKKRAVLQLVDLINRPAGDKNRINPEDFSLLELWEAFIGPVSQTLGRFHRRSGFILEQALYESVDSTAFSIITGEVISAKVIEAYNMPSTIGDQLVTNLPSKRKMERIPGFLESEGPLPVVEGMPYQDSSIGEKYVVVDSASKKGRLISLTEEAILFDQTNQLMIRAMNIGKKMRIDKEKDILTGVMDLNSVVYKPQGVAVALYSGGNGNLKTSNPLKDWTSIEAAELLWDDMKDDSQGTQDEIGILPADRILLSGTALKRTALRILRATDVKHKNNPAAGTEDIQTMGANPVAGDYTPLSSPMIKRLNSDRTGDWWYGDFKSQFVWQEIFPIQTFRQAPGNDAEFEKDIAMRFKVRGYGGIGAICHQLVIKNTP